MSAQRYRTIAADPPWEYPEGFALGPGHGVLEVRPLPYPSMTLEEIRAIDVAELAASGRTRTASGSGNAAYRQH